MKKVLVSLAATTFFLLSTATALPSGWLSPIKLTNNTDSDEVPEINADGTRIAYYSSADGDADIYVLEFRAGMWQEPIKVTHNNTPDTMPSINADGTRIAYIGGEADNRDIYLVEYTDGMWQPPVRLTHNEIGDYFPSIRADGAGIVYQIKDEEGERYLRMVEYRDGAWQEAIDLPAASDNNMFPRISALGNSIAFHAVKDGVRNIYLVQYEEGTWQGPYQLTEDGEHDLQTAVSADGTRIVYYWTGESFLPHVDPTATADVRLLELEGTVWQEPLTIAGSDLYEFDPTISGDGKTITYAEANPGGFDNICVADYEDGLWKDPVNLTEGVTSGNRPNISPGGNHIVYYGPGVMDQDYDVYLLSRAATVGTVAGEVASEEGGEPVRGALLTAMPGGHLAATDEDGQFALRLPAGTFTVRAIMDCFSEGSQEAIISGDGDVSRITFFLARGDCVPFSPRQPYPPNGASDQPLFLTIQWRGGDPDSGDRVTYDVYLGRPTEHHTEMERIAKEHKLTSYTLPFLDPGSTYYWKIVARDNRGGERAGPRWKFDTREKGCPASILLTKESSDIERLRQLRDGVLKRTEVGSRLVKLYYTHAPELTRIFLAHPTLRGKATELLRSSLKWPGAIPPKTEDFVKALQRCAGEDLRQDSEWVLGLLRSGKLEETMNSTYAALSRPRGALLGGPVRHARKGKD